MARARLRGLGALCAAAVPGHRGTSGSHLPSAPAAVPAFGSIGYALFLHLYGPYTSLRNNALGPVTGAAVPTAAVAWVPAGPPRVVTTAAILALRLLRIELPAALAVALLTLLVGGEGALYLGSIAVSSLALMALFRLWRWPV